MILPLLRSWQIKSIILFFSHFSGPDRNEEAAEDKEEDCHFESDSAAKQETAQDKEDYGGFGYNAVNKVSDQVLLC
jgi:hypothetical protein